MRCTSRPYTDDSDLAKIKDLLMAGRAASPHSGTIHPGDLDWRLYYGQRKSDRAEIMHLWEDEAGRLQGFVIFDGADFECYVLSELRGSKLEAGIVEWAETRVRDWIDQNGGDRRITTYAFADDMRWIVTLEERGYVKSEHGHYAYLVRSLCDPIPGPRLPEGFSVRSMGGEEDIEQRAAVHFSAFSPRSRMTPDAYRAFMAAPGYHPDLDSIVVAPDGRFASFAMAWLDPRNRLGEFEPVGTGLDFRGMGLGIAVLLHGLERLKAHDMQQAIVYAEAGNATAIRLYKSVGFQIVNSFCDYEKPAGR